MSRGEEVRTFAGVLRSVALASLRLADRFASFVPIATIFRERFVALSAAVSELELDENDEASEALLERFQQLREVCDGLGIPYVEAIAFANDLRRMDESDTPTASALPPREWLSVLEDTIDALSAYHLAGGRAWSREEALRGSEPARSRFREDVVRRTEEARERNERVLAEARERGAGSVSFRAPGDSAFREIGTLEGGPPDVRVDRSVDAILGTAPESPGTSLPDLARRTSASFVAEIVFEGGRAVHQLFEDRVVAERYLAPFVRRVENGVDSVLLYEIGEGGRIERTLASIPPIVARTHSPPEAVVEAIHRATEVRAADVREEARASSEFYLREMIRLRDGDLRLRRNVFGRFEVIGIDANGCEDPDEAARSAIDAEERAEEPGAIVAGPAADFRSEGDGEEDEPPRSGDDPTAVDTSRPHSRDCLGCAGRTDPPRFDSCQGCERADGRGARTPSRVLGVAVIDAAPGDDVVVRTLWWEPASSRSGALVPAAVASPADTGALRRSSRPSGEIGYVVHFHGLPAATGNEGEDYVREVVVATEEEAHRFGRALVENPDHPATSYSVAPMSFPDDPGYTGSPFWGRSEPIDPDPPADPEPPEVRSAVEALGDRIRAAREGYRSRRSEREKAGAELPPPLDAPNPKLSDYKPR